MSDTAVADVIPASACHNTPPVGYREVHIKSLREVEIEDTAYTLVGVCEFLILTVFLYSIGIGLCHKSGSEGRSQSEDKMRTAYKRHIKVGIRCYGVSQHGMCHIPITQSHTYTGSVPYTQRLPIRTESNREITTIHRSVPCVWLCYYLIHLTIGHYPPYPCRQAVVGLHRPTAGRQHHKSRRTKQ